MAYFGSLLEISLNRNELKKTFPFGGLNSTKPSRHDTLEPKGCLSFRVYEVTNLFSGPSQYNNNLIRTAGLEV